MAEGVLTRNNALQVYFGTGANDVAELRMDPTTHALYIANASTASNPLYVTNASSAPVYVAVTSDQKLYVQGTSSNPVYVSPVAGSPLYVANTASTNPLYVAPIAGTPLYVANTASTNPLYVAPVAGTPLYIANTASTNPLSVAGISGSPVYVATEATEKLWVKGTSSNLVYNIERDHAQIHDSKAFTAHKFTDALANGATASMTFKTHTTSNFANAVFDVRASRFDTAGASRPFSFALYEGATWTAQTGTQVSAVNRDRNSAATSTLMHNGSASDFAAASLIGVAQTGVTGGTKVYEKYVPAGQYLATDHSEEIILKANTQYAAVASVITDSTASVSLTMDWYEQA